MNQPVRYDYAYGTHEEVPWHKKLSGNQWLAAAAIAVVLILGIAGTVAVAVHRPAPQIVSSVEYEPVTNPSPNYSTGTGAVAGFIVSYYQDRNGVEAAAFFDPAKKIDATKMQEEIEKKVPSAYTSTRYQITTIIPREKYQVNIGLMKPDKTVLTVDQIMHTVERNGRFYVSNIEVQRG